MSKVEFEHATVDAGEPVRMDYERKLPEPTVWMTPSGEGFMMRWKPPVTEVAMGWDAMFTEAQLREALAQQEAVMRQALMAFQTTNFDRHAAAVKALEDALRKTVFTTGEPAPEGFYQGAIADMVRNGDEQ